MLRFVYFTLAIILVRASVNFRDCGKGELTEVDVSGCTNSSPCQVKKGQDVIITLIFKANEYSKNATVLFDASVGGFNIYRYEEDACKYITCPINNGETRTITRVVTVPNFSGITPELKIKLVGDNKVTLFCGSGIKIAISN